MLVYVEDPVPLNFVQFSFPLLAGFSILHRVFLFINYKKGAY